MGASFTSRVVAWVVFLSDVLAGQVVSSSLDVTVWVASAAGDRLGTSESFFGLVHGSNFQLIWRETLTQSSSKFFSTSSVPFIRNHQCFPPGLTFFFTVSWLPRVVSLFRVDDTAAIDTDFSVPQILLTPGTTTRSGFGRF